MLEWYTKDVILLVTRSLLIFQSGLRSTPPMKEIDKIMLLLSNAVKS